MVYDIKLFLQEDYLKGNTIWLECDGYDSTPKEDFEPYDMQGFTADIMMSVHRDTGQPLVIVIEGFREETEKAVQELREHPLPWTFSLAGFAKEKPLEDVILAVWKKYRNIEMRWEEE